MASGAVDRGRVLVTLGAALASLVLSSACQGREYSFDYEVQSRAEYRDNVGMNPRQSVDISGVKLSLPMTLAMRDERSRASLLAELTSARFDRSGYNSNDQDVQGRYKRDYARGSFNVGARLLRTSTRETAFFDDGVVGLSTSRVERTGANGSFNYALSEKNRISGGTFYTASTYEDPRHKDGEIMSSFVGVTHALSARLSLQAQLNNTLFRNDARLSVESVGLGGQVGFRYLFSESLDVSLLGGIMNTTTETSTPAGAAPRGDSESRGYLATGSAVYTGERYSLTVQLRSNSNDNGNGYLVQSTRLEANYRYDLSTRASYEVSALGAATRALDERINNDRDFAQLSLGAQYRLSPSWRVSARYVYRYQEREQQSDSATENAVHISLVFNPQTRTWSR